MKKTAFAQIAFTTLVLLSLAFFSSCTKDNDTKPDDPGSGTGTEIVPLPEQSVTTYEGSLVYTPTTGMPVINDNATATIEENGETYTIIFSDNVPSLSNLKFTLDGDEYASISNSGNLTGISIEGDDLSVGSSSGGSSWSFNGEK